MSKLYEYVKTSDELVDFFAFGDTDEVAFYFCDDREDPGYPSVRLPIVRLDELKNLSLTKRLDPEEAMHLRHLAIIVAFAQGRLLKGGWVAEKSWKDTEGL